MLPPYRIQAITQIPAPETLRHRDNLGLPWAGGYSWLWILRFAELAKLLYIPLGALKKLSLVSNRETGLGEFEKPLALVSTSALPDTAEDFQLFVNERKCIVPDLNAKTKTVAMSCW